MFGISKEKYQKLKDDYDDYIKNKEKELSEKDTKLAYLEKEVSKFQNQIIEINEDYEAKIKQLEKNITDEKTHNDKARGGFSAKISILNSEKSELENKVKKLKESNKEKDSSIQILIKENHQLHNVTFEQSNLIVKLRNFIEKKWNRKVPTIEELMEYDKKIKTGKKGK